MQSNYKSLGEHIRLVKVKNSDDSVKELLGINIDKFFMPSVANIVGTDLSKYQIVQKNQFACNRMHVGRDYRIPVAKSDSDFPFIVSPAYDVFEIIDESILLPDYLMLWFKRREFDRNAWFYTDADVRGGLHWKAFIEIKLPIPSLEKQKELIEEYEAIENRIQLNKKLCATLEETAQTIYKHWFEDFEFPDENGKPYKSSGGEMVECEELGKEIPKGWRVGKLEEIAIIIMGQSPSGDSYNYEKNGKIFYQGRTEFGFRFPKIKTFTTEPTRIAKAKDILLSVRAPVGDLNITLNDCCIGRGISAVRSKTHCNSFLFYLMKSVKDQFDISNGEGTIFGSINKDDLHAIKVLISDFKVDSAFENEVSQLDNKIENLCLQTQKLEELKNLLLGKMAVEV